MLGQRFVEAFAGKDAAALQTLLAPDVDFKAVTPGRVWEADDRDVVIGEIFAKWLEPTDHVERIVSVTETAVQDRRSVLYRIAVRNPDGLYEFEQHAYYDTDGERITLMRVACSGFRPLAT